MKPTVYYLPGHGGRIATGLGEGITQRGFAVTGRETVGDFRALPFQAQVDTVASDLSEHFWHKEAQVIAVSYGAYFFLHAQAQLPPFPGNVLLLSPVVGQFSGEDIMMGFIPPRARKLKQMIDAGTLPVPANCQIHVGSEDWQSNPETLSVMASQLGIDVTIMPGKGHELGKDYVGPLLDRWLVQPPVMTKET